MSENNVYYRTCPLCEATCGLEIETNREKVVAIRGDKLDPFSKGHLCPKGFSLKELHDDPDRLRKPMIRKEMEWVEVSWAEAFAHVKDGLRKIIDAHGRDAVGAYLGNPNVHNLAGLLYTPIFLKALRSRYTFSASTMDQIPKQLTAEMMYGSDLSIPIPDVDRTDYFLIIGGNPLVSNGSMMTAPNMKERLKTMKDRGGKFIVIDPVKTLTAKAANEYYSINPGTDAFFLLALVHTLFAENLISLGKLYEHVNGLEDVKKAVTDFYPEVVEDTCGIPAHTIRKIARELSGAKRAAVYGRMGVSTQEFGTLNSWLIEVLNVLTGNLDREGGVLFPLPAAGGKNVNKAPRKNERYRYGRFHGSARGLPEVLGELPVSSMADEIENSGQIKAFITVAGNPILSAPNGERLQSAFEKLEFMVSVDCYLNETTRMADVILPVPSPLERSHYDLSFYQLSVRNIAHYSKPVFRLKFEQLDEWEILLHLTEIISGQEVGVKALDDYAAMKLVEAEISNHLSPIFNRDGKEIFQEINRYHGPERMLDFLLRVGPYGDHFGTVEGGLTLAKLVEQEHGVDLGPLKPRVPEVLLTASRNIELAPQPVIDNVNRVKVKLHEEKSEFVLIGRRNLHSNNSWMHNLPVLVKGKNRCTLQIHPEDADRKNLKDGNLVKVSSKAGSLVAPVELTTDIMRGTVSLPHGWGHRFPDTRLSVANKHAGVNSNLLSDEKVIDAVSGNAVFNGIPIELQKITEKEGEEQEWQFTH